MKLSEITTNGVYGPLAMTNIDDYFQYEVANKGIKEIEVSEPEMLLITRFVVMSCTGSPETYRALTTGIVPEFLGVKLTLNVPSNDGSTPDTEAQ